MKKKLLLIIISSLLILSACNNTPSNQSSNKKLKIVTSFYPLYEIAQNIAGDKAEVINLTQPGVEPHDFEPTPQDFITMQNANLLIINGAGMESWSKKILPDLKQRGVKIIEQSDIIKNNLVPTAKEKKLVINETTGEENSIFDPHFWLDPVYYSAEVIYITGQITDLDPTNKAEYEKNSQKFQEKLLNLHKKYLSTLQDCQKKDFVTSHTAFTYLSKRYNLNAINISGISPEAEPSAKELATLSKILKEKNITYIFTETLVSPKIAETLANEVGAKISTLNPIENLTPEQIKGNKDYISLMEDNLANLKVALDCK